MNIKLSFAVACALCLGSTSAHATFSVAAHSNNQVGSAAATCFDWEPQYGVMMDHLSKVVDGKGAVVTIGQINMSDQNEILAKAERLLNDSTSSPSDIANTLFDGFVQKEEKQSLVVKNYNSDYGASNFNGSQLFPKVDYIVSKNDFVFAGNTLRGTPLQGMAINYASANNSKSLDYKLITSLFGAKRHSESGDKRCVDTKGVSSTVAGVKVVGNGERKYQYFSTNNEDALDGLMSKTFRVDFVSYKENAYPYLNLINTGDKLYFDYDLQLNQFKGYKFVLNAHSYVGGGFKHNVYDVTVNEGTSIEDLKFNSVNSRFTDVFYILNVYNPYNEIVGGGGTQSDSYYGHLWNVSSNYPSDYPYPK